MPPKKVIIEPSDIIMKLPASPGTEFDGIKRRMALRGIETVDLGGIAPPVPPVVQQLISSKGDFQPLSNAEAARVEAELKSKIADWMHSRFDVTLNPEKEILMTTGNTPGVFYTFRAFLNPGERAFIPDPAFSLYRSSAASVGADVETYELSPRTDFLPNLDKMKGAGSNASKIMLINYPHNPTTSVADEGFYERLLKFAQKNNLLIVSDSVYNTHVWERHIHPAAVALPKAKFKTIEFFTFSFMFSLPMLKLGFAVGCKEFLSPLSKMFRSFNSRPSGFDLQIGNLLMDHCDEVVKSVSDHLSRNRTAFEKGISSLGWELQPSHASPFVWIKLPRRRLSLNFCRMLLKRTGVVTLPGTSFGEKGEGFFRISIDVEHDLIDDAIARIMKHSSVYQRLFKRRQVK